MFKKFEVKDEAEKFLKEHKIEKVSCKLYLIKSAYSLCLVEVKDKDLDKYYAVARGKVAGIFTDFNEVKKHVGFEFRVLV